MATPPNLGPPVIPDSKPNEGPSEAFPGFNEGYRSGDAMTDAVTPIQHSGASPAGGDVPQTKGVDLTRTVDRTPRTGGSGPVRARITDH